MIRAVVLDIGNVLIGWDPESFYDARIGPDRRRALFAEVDLDGMNARVDLGEGFRDIIYAVADHHPQWRSEICMWHDDWLHMITPVIDQSVRLQRALRAKGVPVHALTNFGAESFDLAARHFDFLSEFDGLAVSGRLRVAKPDPAIYAEVERQVAVPPGAILFTDDRPDNVTAAAARGWSTHLFTEPGGWAARLVEEGLLSAEEAA